MLAALFAFSIVSTADNAQLQPVLVASNTAQGTSQEQQEVDAYRAEANKWGWTPTKEEMKDKGKREKSLKALRKYEKEYQEYEKFWKDYKGPIPDQEGVYDEPWQFPRHSHGL